MGDMILQEVAELLQENERDADIVVRYGGDEILIMMPETDGVLRVLPHHATGSHRLAAAAACDALLVLEEGARHWREGESVEVLPY